MGTQDSGDRWALVARAADSGRAYTARNNQLIHETTVNNFIIVQQRQRADDAASRLHAANEAAAKAEVLETQLTLMSEWCVHVAAKARRDVKAARAEGRAEAEREASLRLAEAERRRKAVEKQLQAAERERDTAKRLMHKAQQQELEARNDLEELQQRYNLETALSHVRQALYQETASDSFSLFDDATYERYLEQAQSGLVDLRRDIHRLSTQLTDPGPDPWSQDVDRVSESWEPYPAHPGSQPRTYSDPLVEAAPLQTGDSILALPPNASRPDAARVSRGRTWSSVVLVLMAFAPQLLISTSLTDMSHYPVGPAVIWRLTYYTLGVPASYVITALIMGTAVGLGRWGRANKTSNGECAMWALWILLQPVALILPFFVDCTGAMVIGPVAHLLAQWIGPA